MTSTKGTIETTGQVGIQEGQESHPKEQPGHPLSVIRGHTADHVSVAIEKEPLPRLKTYNLSNFRTLAQIRALGEEAQFEMEVVAHVLPFKTNNYVVDELID